MDKQRQLERAERWTIAAQKVRTAKGAPFVGHVIAKYFNPWMEHWGVVVVAGDNNFQGCVHVYPVAQLMEVE